MPIKIISKKQDGGFLIEQSATRPLVFLDTWALNLFAYQDVTLRETLTRLLIEKEGTLILTYIHLYEVCKRDDMAQVEQILDFIDSVNCAFLLSNPMEVIKREKRFRLGDTSFGNSPWADFSLVKYLFISSDASETIKFSLIFSELKKELLKGGKLESPFDKFLTPIVIRARNDPKALQRTKNRLKRIKEKVLTERPYTKEIYYKSIDYMVGNEQMKINDNDWRDIAQLIVAVSYCDFALADRRWVSFIEKTGLAYPDIARVYHKSQTAEFIKYLRDYELP